MSDRDFTRQQADWLEQLRRRMVEITRRRVPEDDVEDLVQQALSVIVERTGEIDQLAEIEGQPRLAWCLQVLRNVIGNHYRRQATRRRVIDGSVAPEDVGRPMEAMTSLDRIQAIEDGLAELAVHSPDCGRYLQRMLDEVPVHVIAQESGLEANALYQRLYRCRRKLRDILRQKGVMP